MQTKTDVHSDSSAQRMLRESAAHESSAALAVSLYAQLLCMSALGLLNLCATSSYMALLFALPAGIGVYLLSARAVQRKASVPRAVYLGFALLFVSDMAVSLFALIELLGAYILPDAPRHVLIFTVVLTVTLMMGGRAHGGAARAAYLLRGFFLLALIVCLCFALPGGNAGFLHPLLGYGGGQTLRGALFMTGGLWSAAALPLFTQNADQPFRKSLRFTLHPLLSVLLMALLLLCYAFLLPAPLLPGDWGFALQLQLLMEMSPNTLAWSLMLISRMLLFLTGFAAAGDFARLCLSRALKKSRVPLWPLALLCLPPVLPGVPHMKNVLIFLLPCRFPAALALTAVLVIKSARRRKETP